MDETPQQPPRIPGVKYRRVKRKRLVTFEWKGQPKQRKEAYIEWVPVPPVNLDRLFLRAVIAIAVSLTLIAVVWSTTAIGRLLKGMVPGHEAAGYIGALAFEVPWVACLLVQWILRDEPKRALPAVIGGWLGLGVVVGAVLIDGHDLKLPIVGGVAACVSVLAKGLWWIVFRLVHRPLDEEHAGQLDAIRQDLSVERVMLTETSRLSGEEAYLAAVYGTTPIAARTPLPELPAGSGPVPDASGPRPDVTAAPAPAVALAASAPVVVPPVADAPGQSPRTVSAQVRPPAAPTVPPTSGPGPDPVAAEAPATSGPAEETTAAVPVVPPPLVPPVHPIAGGSIAGTIRAALKADPGISDADLVAKVAAVHGQRPTLAETVRRTRSKEEKRLKAS